MQRPRLYQRVRKVYNSQSVLSAGCGDRQELRCSAQRPSTSKKNVKQQVRIVCCRQTSSLFRILQHGQKSYLPKVYLRKNLTAFQQFSVAKLNTLPILHSIHWPHCQNTITSDRFCKMCRGVDVSVYLQESGSAFSDHNDYVSVCDVQAIEL